MIWGLTLEPGCVYTQSVTAQTHLSLATLDCRGKVFAGTDPVKVSHVVLKTNSCEQLVCSLVQGLVLQQQLDLKIMPHEEVSFSNQGNCCVYITGYSIDPDFSEYKYEETTSLCASETGLNEVQTNAYNKHPGWETEDSQLEEEEEKRSPGDGGRDATDGSMRSEAEESRVQESNSLAPVPSQMTDPVFEETDVNNQVDDVVCIAVKEEPEDDTEEGVSQSHHDDHSTTTSETEVWSHSGVPQQLDSHQNATAYSQDESVKDSEQQLFLGDGVQTGDVSEDSRADVGDEFCEVLVDEGRGSREGSAPEWHSDTKEGTGHRKTSGKLQHSTNNLLPVSTIQSDLSPVMLQQNIKSQWTASKIALQSPQPPSSVFRTNKNRLHQRSFISVVQRQPPSILARLNSSKSISSVGQVQCTASNDSVSHLRRNQDPVKPRMVEYRKEFSGRLNRFQCKFCGKSLNCRRSLIHHEMIHTGDKPFTCRFCQKSFIQKSQWKVHERIHTGVKPFVCRICGKAFSRLYNKKMHAKTCEEFCATGNGKQPD